MRRNRLAPALAAAAARLHGVGEAEASFAPSGVASIGISFSFCFGSPRNQSHGPPPYSVPPFAYGPGFYGPYPPPAYWQPAWPAPPPPFATPTPFAPPRGPGF